MIKKTIEYIRIPKWAVYGFAFLIIGWFVYRALAPKRIDVDLGEITSGPFRSYLVSEGVASIKNKHLVSSPADGIVPEHSLKVGDRVKKGETLIVFQWDFKTPVTSPIDGVILTVFEKDRRHVMRGTPLFEIGNPSDLEIVAKVLTSEAVAMNTNQQALIRNWGGSTELEAKISNISPTATEEVSVLGVKEQKVAIRLDVVSQREQWLTLGDGYRVEVAILTLDLPNTIQVPLGALVAHEGGAAVYLVDPGRKKVRLTPVKIIARGEKTAAIATAIAIGGQVVVYPPSSLVDGAAVKPRNQ